MAGRFLLANNAHRGLLQALDNNGTAPVAASSPYPGGTSVRIPRAPPSPIIFAVLGSLLAVLVILIVFEGMRRRGCMLWRPSTWRSSSRPGASAAGPAARKQALAASALREVKVVPLLVIMPDQQVQCAMKADPSGEIHVGGALKADPEAAEDCPESSADGSSSTASSSTAGSDAGSIHNAAI